MDVKQSGQNKPGPVALIPAECALTFFPLQIRVGEQIRDWRNRCGLSLRELELRSGVNDSEISKIESGSQSCRLESFIRVCTAMAVPAGFILNDVIQIEPSNFKPSILKSELVRDLANGNRDVQQYLADQITALAVVVAKLFVSERPGLLLSLARYADRDFERRMFALGDFIQHMESAETRLKHLRNLQTSPIEQLHEFNVLPLACLKELAEALEADFESGPDDVKRAFNLMVPLISAGQNRAKSTGEIKNEQQKYLTDAETSDSLDNVIPNLPKLLERLKRATSDTGKMSELANWLEVPLASVSRWLSGKREPGGKVTLKMYQWVERQERQK